MRAKVIFYKKGKDRYELMLRLTQKGKRKHKSLNSGITIDQWDYKNQRLKGVKPANTEKYQTYLKNKKYVKDIENKYTKQINELLLLNKPFSLDRVIQLVEKPKQANTTFFEVFDQAIVDLKKESRFGSADCSSGTLTKFKRFHKQDLMFNELDDNLLIKFKESMLKDELSPTSVGIHLRNIRIVYNLAIKKKVANINDYPFKNTDIMKGLKTGYRSRAISKFEVDKIRDLKKKTEIGSSKWDACNYFIFGYVGRGINFQDIARLKWDNYSEGRISFVRFKTRSKIQEYTSFNVNDELYEILTYYRKTNLQLNNPYIFPILNSFHNTEERKHTRIKRVRKEINKELNLIGKELEFDIKLTSYVWRHSFASIAKNTLKVDVSLISEMLGHHSLETTKAYLKQFPDEDKDRAVIGL